jgi:hypothetical protein
MNEVHAPSLSTHRHRLHREISCVWRLCYASGSVAFGSSDDYFYEKLKKITFAILGMARSSLKHQCAQSFLEL